MRLLLHAPTEAALDRARSHARGLIASLPEAEVEIVVNGDGVRAAVESSDPGTDGLIVYCAHSLRTQGIEPPSAPAVSSAVRYMVERQAAGWAYIRA